MQRAEVEPEALQTARGIEQTRTDTKEEEAAVWQEMAGDRLATAMGEDINSAEYKAAKLRGALEALGVERPPQPARDPTEAGPYQRPPQRARHPTEASIVREPSSEEDDELWSDSD